MRWNEGTDGDEGDDNLCKYILKLVLGISEKKNQVTMVHSIAALLFKITLVQMQRRILSSE